MTCPPDDERNRKDASLSDCEPLPVALDLRFLDDDHSDPEYGLPVALDLDWESGEP